MDPERQRIQDDLRGLVAGDVRCDDVLLPLFGSDASIFQVQPLAVVRPRTAADVSKVVGYAAEKKLPIHRAGPARGWLANRWDAGLLSIFPATCDASCGPTVIRYACNRASFWDC